MLEQMRAMAKTPVATALIGLLIVSFAVWGISGVFKGGQGDAVAVVGPGKVSVQDYATAWDRELNRVIQQSQGKVTSRQAREFGLAEQLLQRMITTAALRAKAAQMGIGMSDRLVAQTIRGLEAFRDPISGKFGEEQYRSALANARYTPQQFENDVRSDLLQAQILDPVSDGVVAPRMFAKIELMFQNERRKIIEIILPDSMAPPIAEPTEAQLQAFLKAHEQVFRTPERRAATLVTISARDLASDITVPEEKIKELYAFRKDKYATPETRSWVQISTADEASAKAVAQRLKNGESAEAIAKALGLTPPLKFDNTDAEHTPDETITKAVFAARPGDTGATKGRLAWAAWRLDSVTPATSKSLDDVRQSLKDEFIKEEASDKLYELVGNFEDARASGATIEEAAESSKLLALSLPPVDRQGRGKDGNPVEPLAGQPEILKTLFETDEGAESEILQTANGDFYAVRTDSIEPPKVPPLAQIRDKVAKVWKAQQKADAIRAIAARVEKALKSGEDANAVAARFPGARVELALLQRGQSPAPLSGRHANRLFAVARGDVVTAPDQSGSNLVVARVDAIMQPRTFPPALIEQHRAAISQSLAGDLQSEYLQALLSQYKVRIDQRLKALALGDNPEG